MDKGAASPKGFGAERNDVLRSRRLRRSIVLVGLMGAGKTSVGKRLAEKLNVPFFDSDVEIETASAGMSVPEIFERFGEPEFRRLERDVVRRLLAGPPAVIATGGGAFVQDETRAAIAASALSVWLEVELETLLQRVLGRSGRPLLDVEDPAGALSRLAESRAPIYAHADLCVPAGMRQTQDEVACAIIAAVTEYDKREMRTRC